ncbi:hypothetical protein QAD02_006043 [Eretmocerus hayati]|uniref:Uncharacterized protein n=1 Tax=Eretmocerus hayati TaxID=131215 RepID=A0ACC2N0M2_9HYME|nr:hypothetical protein QAD02_006043 [Eretmocerus hayati]
MAKVYQQIELDENEISKIFREVLPEISKKSASSLRSLERRAKRCYKIIGDILNSTVDLPQSTGRKEALEAKADRLKRIYLILERERLGRKESSVIFFEGESAFRRRIRSGIVGNIYHSDPIEFLKEAQHFIVTFIQSAVRDLKVLKVNLIFNNYFNLKDEKSEIKHFKTDFEIIMESSNLDEWYEEHTDSLINQMIEFEGIGSGWTLEEILTLKIVICKTDVINGSSYIKLPKVIADKKAVINIDCRNSRKNDCFAWCIMAHLESSDTRFLRQNSMDSYTHYRKVLDFKGIDFPMALKDIPSFELKNKISVNVYQLSKANHIYPVYVTSKEEGKRRHVNLLLLLNGKKSHYCYIRNLSRLLSSQVSSHKGRVFVCNSCFHCFYSQKKLDIHKKNCSNKNLNTIVLPNDENKILKFKNFYKKEAIPCVIYVDTECLLKLCDHKLDGDPHLEVNDIRQDDSYTENEEDPISKHDYPELKKSEIMKNSFQKHEAYSIGFYYHDRYEEDKCFYDKFRGLNCVRKFAERLKEIAIQIQRVSMQKSNIL